MILCCGEALIDMILNLDGTFAPHAGGAVFNTAIGLGRQGVDVGLLSGISEDLFGKMLVQSLKDSGVSTAHLIRSSRPSTLAFVVVKDGKASYAFYDENTAGRMLFPSSEPITLPQEVNALFFGGISLAVEPCADFYVDLLKVNAKNRFVMVDPNIRPQFISNEVRYRARLTEVLGLTDVLKISDEDLLWIDPTPENLDIKIDKLLSSGPKLICLTLGGEGVNLYSQDGLIVKTLPPSVQVVDTVGAGDAFNAGFLSCLSKNKSLDKTSIAAMTDHDLQSILNFATAFASDTVTRQGSNPAWYFEE